MEKEEIPGPSDKGKGENSFDKLLEMPRHPVIEESLLSYKSQEKL